MAVDVTTTRGATPGNPLNEPINKSNDYLAMLDYWDIIDVILGGASVIRAAGEKYLPRFQNETLTEDASGNRYDPYEPRRLHAPFTNIFEDIVQNLASKPFAHELELDESVGEPYVTLAEDIDGMGNNLHTFAQEVFQAAINYSITWLLVDYSRAITRPDGQVLSLADEASQQLRPYWVHVLPTNLYAVYSDFINGREEFVHVRIYEPTLKLEGYIERMVQRVRVIQRPAIAWDASDKPIDYGPPEYAVFEQVIEPGQDTGSWVLIEQGVYSIGYIPLVPVMTGTRIPGTWQLRPPLKGLAYLQIEEYQQESNLKTVLEQAAFPMLCGDGVTPDGNNQKVPMGPRTVLFGGSSVDGRPGTWKFIEPAGSSITALETRLEKTRSEMRDLGKQPMTQQNLTVITTGQVALKANSQVQAWALLFKDSLETAWKYTADWLGRTEEPEVDVFLDFNVALDDGRGWAAVWQLRTNRDISRETALDSAKRYGYLPENFDAKQDEELLASESEQMQLQAEQGINPVTGMPISQTAIRQNGGQQQPSNQRSIQ